MPSIASFIRELLSEEKYSSGYSNRIKERVQELNAAQLQGIYNHLKHSVKEAKTDMWKNANKEIINNIEEILKEKTAVEIKEKKIVEEARLKKKQQAQKIREVKKEQKRVMKMIEDKARDQATQEIKETENRRQAAEKLSLLQRVYQAEEKRNKWWKITSIVYILAFVGVCIFFSSNILLLIPILIGLTIIAGTIAYRAYLFTNIKPLIYPEEYIQKLVDQREEELRKEGLKALRVKELLFEEQQKKDEEYRRNYKAMKKEKLRYEAELIEQQRLERIAMAKEILHQKEAASKFNPEDASFVDLENIPETEEMELSSDFQEERSESELNSGINTESYRQINPNNTKKGISLKQSSEIELFHADPKETEYEFV